MKHYVMLGAQKVPLNSTVATGSFTLQINKTLYIVFWSLCFCLHWAPLGVTRLKQSLRWMCQLSPRILQVISKVAKAPTIVNEKISSEQKQGSQSWQTPPQTPIYPHFPESWFVTHSVILQVSWKLDHLVYSFFPHTTWMEVLMLIKLKQKILGFTSDLLNYNLQ